MIKSIDISHKTIFFIAAFLGILWLLYLILDVIMLLFVAIIFMSTLSPIVERLIKWGFPKTLAILLCYIVVISVIGLLLTVVITPLATQTSSLATNLPATLDKMLPSLGIDKSLLQEQLTSFSHNVFSFTLTIFSNFVTFISIAVLTFYLLLDRERFYRLITQLFPPHEERTHHLINKIEGKLGAWLRGQIILSVFIGVMAFGLLVLFNVPYALPLAILSGLMEVVPVIGPIISAIPAVLLAFTISPAVALFVAIGFFIIQQAESHFIVPQLMRRAVGLNPLVIILAIAIGGRLLGIAGALLAVPITVVIQVIAEEYLHVQLDI